MLVRSTELEFPTISESYLTDGSEPGLISSLSVNSPEMREVLPFFILCVYRFGEYVALQLVPETSPSVMSQRAPMSCPLSSSCLLPKHQFLQAGKPQEFLQEVANSVLSMSMCHSLEILKVQCVKVGLVYDLLNSAHKYFPRSVYSKFELVSDL